MSFRCKAIIIHYYKQCLGENNVSRNFTGVPTHADGVNAYMRARVCAGGFGQGYFAREQVSVRERERERALLLKFTLPPRRHLGELLGSCASLNSAAFVQKGNKSEDGFLEHEI
jgi:hypothetical protein